MQMFVQINTVLYNVTHNSLWSWRVKRKKHISNLYDFYGSRAFDVTVICSNQSCLTCYNRRIYVNAPVGLGHFSQVWLLLSSSFTYMIYVCLYAEENMYEWHFVFSSFIWSLLRRALCKGYMIIYIYIYIYIVYVNEVAPCSRHICVLWWFSEVLVPYVSYLYLVFTVQAVK